MAGTTRETLRSHVERNPGRHFNALVRDLDLAPGQVQYHLRRLRKDDAVVEEQYYGQTHYYPPDWDPWERGVLALVRRETSRDVLFDLLERGPDGPGAVAERVGVARSTLEWHVGHLVEQDVVRKERDSANRVTLKLVAPERTVELLNAVEPSLPERLVDRFERLLDGLLADGS
ncbi:winged helix-turn-helix transcriptional regulator [Halorussus lipolyticus]|uniref:winged helix-turn-helix transcriptional regulator n=1 Tax=Halorussus lipolyticus TaxID=3034024 RepID=UPI0023E8C4DE|nr:ArsR family transcriptional regulator [Halorussus sp. DT80]